MTYVDETMNDQAHPDEIPNDADQRRVLELELVKVRKEAELARLEARAAELELLIRRMANGESVDVNAAVRRVDAAENSQLGGRPQLPANLQPAAKSQPVKIASSELDQQVNAANRAGTPHTAQSNVTRAAASSVPVVFGQPSGQPTTTNDSVNRGNHSHTPVRRFSSWQALRDAALPTDVELAEVDPEVADLETVNLQTVDLETVNLETVNLETVNLETVNLETVDARVSDEVSVAHPGSNLRIDEAVASSDVVPTPKLDLSSSSPPTAEDAPAAGNEALPPESLVTRRVDSPVKEKTGNNKTGNEKTTTKVSASENPVTKKRSAAAKPVLLFTPEEENHESVVEAEDVDIEADDDEEESENTLRKPAAWLVSTVAHVAVLLLLAAFTLANPPPQDQVALSASVSEVGEEVMETFEIETSEPETEQTDPSQSDTEYEISPMGEMAVAEFSPDAPPAPPAPSTSDMLSSSAASAASMSMKSNSDAKIQFCGVEGGGNNFCYLVDSSGSMGDAFESARRELLTSIDALTPKQKFYVVFFDAESDYMRLSDPNSDETRSVKATTQNKLALKRWAMRISMDRGRAPYDPIKFALKLKPDVIFLLSDGEFPQGIEDLLKENNHSSNLFGDENLISIVHTIGYHSREGESRMKRIAEQNKGQYRHVPKP